MDVGARATTNRGIYRHMAATPGEEELADPVLVSPATWNRSVEQFHRMNFSLKQANSPGNGLDLREKCQF
jgi:hypothetical protein